MQLSFVSVTSFSVMPCSPCCISLLTLAIPWYSWIQCVFPFTQHMVLVRSLQRSSKVQHNEMELFPSFHWASVLMVLFFCYLNQFIRTCSCWPKTTSQICQDIQVCPETSRTIFRWANALFLSLNELEIDTILFLLILDPRVGTRIWICFWVAQFFIMLLESHRNSLVFRKLWEFYENRITGISGIWNLQMCLKNHE